jgi:hypothetical protein
MDDFYDGDFMDDSNGDFGDDGNNFMEDDSMEDSFNDDLGSEDSFDDDLGIEDEPTDDMCEDEFTVEDAVILGSAMGWAYEEGLEEAKRRKLEKKMNANPEQSNNHS